MQAKREESYKSQKAAWWFCVTEMKAWVRRPGTRQRGLAKALPRETRKAFFKIRLTEI